MKIGKAHDEQRVGVMAEAQYLAQWRKTFAWFPTKVVTGERRWFEYIEVRLPTEYFDVYDHFKCFACPSGPHYHTGTQRYRNLEQKEE